MILKGVAQAMSPAGQEARLSILIFHRVLPQPDALFPNEPDEHRFDQVLTWLRRWFVVMPLSDALSRLQTGTLPARAAAITFDDGYADNASHALPILQRHGVVASFFVSTGFLDGGCLWNDAVIESLRRCTRRVLDLRDAGLGIFLLETWSQKRQAVAFLLAQIKRMEPSQRGQTVAAVVEISGSGAPPGLMMRPEQILQLRNAGMEIGAHTCTHPILESASDGLAWEEIVSSKTVLQSLLGEAVDVFAYPNGKPGVDYSARHVAMVRKAGFLAAVSTVPGVSWRHSDLYQLPRFTPWDQGRTRYGLRLLDNLRTPVPAQPMPV